MPKRDPWRLRPPPPDPHRLSRERPLAGLRPRRRPPADRCARSTKGRDDGPHSIVFASRVLSSELCEMTPRRRASRPALFGDDRKRGFQADVSTNPVMGRRCVLGAATARAGRDPARDHGDGRDRRDTEEAEQARVDRGACAFRKMRPDPLHRSLESSRGQARAARAGRLPASPRGSIPANSQRGPRGS